MTPSQYVEQLIDLLDWPSGSILGLHTLLIIVGSVVLVVLRVKHPETGYEFPSSVVDIYKFVLLNFSVVKGAKAGATLFGHFMKDETPPPEAPKQ